MVPAWSPVPVCIACGVRISLTFQRDTDVASGVAAERARIRQEFEAEQEARRKISSVVYYVRIGDHIKIGYTSDLDRRLMGLRVDGSDLLAWEPGGRELEQQRHHEFRAARISRREDFHPTDRLKEHLEELRAKHGLPQWLKRPSRSVTLRTT